MRGRYSRPRKRSPSSSRKLGARNTPALQDCLEAAMQALPASGVSALPDEQHRRPRGAARRSRCLGRGSSEVSKNVLLRQATFAAERQRPAAEVAV
jgi:hypothetical protein